MNTTQDKNLYNSLKKANFDWQKEKSEYDKLIAQKGTWRGADNESRVLKLAKKIDEGIAAMKEITLLKYNM